MSENNPLLERNITINIKLETFTAGTEDLVTGLTVCQLLVRVRVTARHQLPLLLPHQLQQLVDQEGGGDGGDSPGWNENSVPAYWTVEIFVL